MGFTDLSSTQSYPLLLSRESQAAKDHLEKVKVLVPGDIVYTNYIVEEILVSRIIKEIIVDNKFGSGVRVMFDRKMCQTCNCFSGTKITSYLDSSWIILPEEILEFALKTNV